MRGDVKSRWVGICVLMGMMCGCGKVPPVYPQAVFTVFGPEGGERSFWSVQKEISPTPPIKEGEPKISLVVSSCRFHNPEDGYSCEVEWDHVKSSDGEDEYRVRLRSGTTNKTEKTVFVKLRGSPVEVLNESGYRLVLQPSRESQRS